MYSTISGKAWDVPNSDLVVQLKQERPAAWWRDNKMVFVAGVAKKLGNGTIGNTLFNDRGADAYSAFENLMAKIDRAAEVAFRVLDRCGSVDPNAVPVLRLQKWEPFPRRDDDFPLMCFSSLSRLLYLMDTSKKDFNVFIRDDRDDDGGVTRHACIAVGDDIVFMAKPSFEKREVMSNLVTAVAGALAMLEKFQGIAWNLMVDSSDAEYDIRLELGNKESKLVRSNGND